MKDKAGPKAALKTAQTGTPVPSKDFSSAKKESKAAGNGKPEKGSAATAKGLPVPAAASTPVETDKKYEGSAADWSQDYRGAKAKGMTSEQYEGTAKDRIEDAAGQKRLNADDSDKVQHAPDYKKGVSAFSNTPKSAHGFGHPTSARDGHLRMSGHSGSHRLGKKK